ncbi:MAG: membrane protein insertion efficiency factor YidD [bacterium]
MFKKIAVFLITAYQYTLSLDHGPLRVLFPMGFCRFHPSCSEYGKQAIDKYGVFRGSWLAVWRIMRCNPWNKGGDDPVH